MSDVNNTGQFVTAPLDVDALVDRCVGSFSLAERILSRFESRFDEDLQSLEQSRDQRDCEELGNVAHRLKGSAASVAAPGIAEASEQLERLARFEEFDAIPACLERLRQEWHEFSAYTASLPRPFADP